MKTREKIFDGLKKAVREMEERNIGLTQPSWEAILLAAAYLEGRHNWIPVEEERPKFDWIDDGSWSSSLPILIYSIHGISIGTFQLDHMTGKSYWCFDGSKHEEFAGEWRIITHWMPLPQPPRKEE